MLKSISNKRDSFGCVNYDMSENITTTKTLINYVSEEIYRKKGIPNNYLVVVNIHLRWFF